MVAEGRQLGKPVEESIGGQLVLGCPTVSVRSGPAVSWRCCTWGARPTLTLRAGVRVVILGARRRALHC